MNIRLPDATATAANGAHAAVPGELPPCCMASSTPTRMAIDIISDTV